MYVLILGIAVIVCWLIAEFRATRPVRIALGLLSLAVVLTVTNFCNGMITTRESDLHRAAFRELSQIATAGDFTLVQRALSAYNETAKTGASTYAAAAKLLATISTEPKKAQKP